MIFARVQLLSINWQYVIILVDQYNPNCIRLMALGKIIILMTIVCILFSIQLYSVK